MKRSLFSRVFIAVTAAIDRRIGWDKLPKPLGLLVLAGIRDRLREENLYDVGRGQLDRPPSTSTTDPARLTTRTIDGTYNDLGDPLMGSLNSRFGRNIPLDCSYPDPLERLLAPSPRLVSRRLLTRDQF